MQFRQLKRREFVTLVGGAAVAWPLAARAQRPNPMRRVAVISQLAADDPEVQARMAAFHQGLQEAGWSVGRNVRKARPSKPLRIRAAFYRHHGGTAHAANVAWNRAINAMGLEVSGDKLV